MSGFKPFLWRLSSLSTPRKRGSLVALLALEGHELRELPQKLGINPGRVLLESLQTTFGDAELGASRALKQTGLRHVRSGPSNPIVEHRLPAAWQELFPIFRNQLEFLCEKVRYVAQFVYPLVTCKSQHREHQTLIV